jgi:hypothetical protein
MVGHDRRRIGVDQDHFVAFFPQGFARLGARIIKFTGLTDNDRPRSNQQNLLNISTTRHGKNLDVGKHAYLSR